MDAVAAGMSCSGSTDANKTFRAPLLTNEMTKNQRKRQRRQERKESLLNEGSVKKQNQEQGKKLRTAAEIRKECLKVKEQLKLEQEKLTEFNKQKNLEHKKLADAVSILVAKLTALKAEKRKITDNSTAKKQKKNNTNSVPEPKPQSAGNQQSSSVNVKKEQVTQASKSPTCLVNLTNSPTVEANSSSGIQGLPVQRISPAENSFLPFVPRCETCRSVLCCDKSIILHKRLQCSSQANRA